MGRESSGDGVSVVVVGVTPHRGRRESRPQGEGTQADGQLKGKGCEMHGYLNRVAARQLES
jgi:hypothetical protein